jgi:peptide-methionine (R)-S-oxide reductase
MKTRTRQTGLIALALLVIVFCIGISIAKTHRKTADSSLAHPSVAYANYSEDDWRKILTPEQYHILREAGTETPGTSPLLNEHRPGTYVTADCGEPVFRSEQKFDSGTGWPSFWAPITPDAVIEEQDTSLFLPRTEIRSKCGGHLGHVFNDGPQPTGLRYCMNGAALKFIPDEPAS